MVDELQVDILPEAPIKPRYTLSSEDFRSPPTKIERHRLETKVTRNSFISFINNSFAVSRGFSSAQSVYFDWIDHHEGFDAKTAIKNFLDAGGVDVLSNEEKQKIWDEYQHVRLHATSMAETIKKDPRVTDYTFDGLLDTFAKELNKMIDPSLRDPKIKTPFILSPEVIKTISLGELKTRISEHARIHSLYKRM